MDSANPQATLETLVSPTICGHKTPRRAPAGAGRWQIGSLVSGRYQLTALLGRGGMGEVYEARDRRLQRTVAIKIGQRHIAEEALRHEARVLAGLDHEGIPAAYDLGSHGGYEYLIMERIEGVTLEAELAGRPLPVALTCRILRALCEALREVHQRGVAHCDLKTANVMLARDGRVVLIDFGIAEVAPRPRGTISGSIHYMAPEATLGEVEAGQAYLLDIYALGVIAFEMLTGHVPFDAKSPPELLEMHRERPAPPVLRNDVPEALSRLVARMLGKRAADRPDAAAVIAALDAVPGAVPPMARAA